MSDLPNTPITTPQATPPATPVPPLPGSAPGNDGNDGVAAVGLMAAAMLILPMMDIAAKYLSSYMPPLQVTFGRFFFQLVVCVIFAAVTGQFALIKSKRPGINFLRGTLLAMASLIFFTAVKFMPVTTAMAIFFVEPMILTILAAVVLKEKFGIRRLGAILIGLVGAMMILRPSFAEVGLVALLPLATASCFACYLLLNRKYAGTDNLLAIQFSAGLAGTLILGTLLLIGSVSGAEDFSFVVPSLPHLGLVAAIGAISFVGHGLVVTAFQKGEAGVLAPLQYLEIVSATILGYLIFSDFPDAMTWAGIALIIAGGVYIAHRERKLQHRG
ncbi:DMT family transporter [Roseibium sp.]|uniref:DMT family transporter n=1 Tax=Roseibium sp. TaxID=1936156 RepID=UPI003A975861